MANNNSVYVINVHVNEQGAFGNDEAFILGVYVSEELAVEAAIAEARNKFCRVYCNECDVGDAELNWGEWDLLPETEAERTEDDDYSKEGVINAIRAAGGSFRISVPNGSFYELTVTEEEVISE